MVQLVDSDIRTREVLGWQGVHVLHFIGSSCSQKLRDSLTSTRLVAGLFILKHTHNLSDEALMRAQ